MEYKRITRDLFVIGTFTVKLDTVNRCYCTLDRRFRKTKNTTFMYSICVLFVGKVSESLTCCVLCLERSSCPALALAETCEDTFHFAQEDGQRLCEESKDLHKLYYAFQS